MKLRVVTKKYFEDCPPNDIARIFTHLPPNDEIGAMRGSLYTLISIKGPEEMDGEVVVSTFLDILEKEYFTPSPVTIPLSLEKAVKTALFSINDIFEKQNITEDIVFDFASAVINEDIVYIARVQEGCIYLIRDNKVVDLGRSLTDVSNPVLVENGSGILCAGDKIILANISADNMVADWALLSRYSEAEVKRLLDPNREKNEKIVFMVLELEDAAEAQPVPPINALPKEDIPQHIPVDGVQVESFKKDTVIENLLNAGDRVVEGIQAVWVYIFEKVKSFLSKNDSIKKVSLKTGIGIIERVKAKKKVQEPSDEEVEGKQRLASNFRQTNADEFHSRRNIRNALKKNKKIVVVCLFLGIILLGGAGIKIRSVLAYQQKVTQYNNIIAQVKSDITKAKETTDPVLIDNEYASVNQLITAASVLGVSDNSLPGYQKQITQYYDTIHGIIDTTVSAQVLSDLSLSFPGVKPNSLAVDGGNLLVTSESNGNAYFVSSSGSSSGTALNSNLLTGPVSVTNVSQGNAVIYDKTSGALLVDAQGNITQIPGLTDIKNIVSISSFNANLYFLDPTDQVIYKAAAADGGYGLAVNYITDTNLTDANALAVDGNVFVVSPSAGILRYYAGKPTQFTINNSALLGKSMGPLTYIYDTQTLANIYVVDPQNSRIIVLQKPLTGQAYTYVRQYIYTGSKHLFNDLQAICIDSNEKNMYVLDGSKVIKVSL